MPLSMEGADQGGTVEVFSPLTVVRGDFLSRSDMFPRLILKIRTKEVISMKFSSKIQACELSPIRKFHPYVLAAEAKGRKVHHLNIGQPDIETPKAFLMR